MRRREDARMVYSTAAGRVCPTCRRPTRECACRASPRAPRGDGVVRVRREVAGRRGRTVTTVAGVPLDADALRDLASELKRHCGSGGSAKDGIIEIQGDHRDAVAAVLRERGFEVKLAGG